jgi:hypothetical protein
MYENGKMRPFETIQGMERGRIKENHGKGEFNYDICEKFCRCHNVSLCNNNKNKV